MSGGAGAFSSAVGALVGLYNNLYTNNVNMRNFDAQLGMQHYMYEDTKNYNSAASQVRRLRSAGMNPAFMFGQNAGQSTATSVPSAPSAIPIDNNALAHFADSFTLNDVTAQNIEADASLKQAQATGQAIDNKYNADEHLARIANTNMDKGLKQMLIKGAQLDNVFAQRSMEDRLKQQLMQSQLTEAQATAQFYTNQYLPVKLQADIDNVMATAKAALENGRASLTQAHAAIMNATNQRHAFDAQYGGNPKAREAYSKAVYGYLLEQSETERSKQFDYQTSGVMGTGAKLQYQGFYKDWKNKR